MPPADARDSPIDKHGWSALLRGHLARAKELRQAANSEPRRFDGRMRLRDWQAQRLARTHRDLLESDRYREAAQFFLNDLYGPKDFSERDDEVERILPTLIALLPAAALHAIASAIEVDALSEQLDAAMVAELQRTRRIDAIDEAAYARAYRACDNRAERARQIALIGEVGARLDRLAHVPLIAIALRLMHGPAHMAGLGELHDFLERGYFAFRGMGGAQEFLDRIVSRETRVMERLFGGAARPFD
jgi:hypothetical protein